jgi:hypothetical protein
VCCKGGYFERFATSQTWRRPPAVTPIRRRPRKRRSQRVGFVVISASQIEISTVDARFRLTQPLYPNTKNPTCTRAHTPVQTTARCPHKATVHVRSKDAKKVKCTKEGWPDTIWFRTDFTLKKVTTYLQGKEYTAYIGFATTIHSTCIRQCVCCACAAVYVVHVRVELCLLLPSKA